MPIWLLLLVFQALALQKHLNYYSSAVKRNPDVLPVQRFCQGVLPEGDIPARETWKLLLLLIPF